MKATEFRLDNRLMLCASFVRDGARLADIGTDHAYLPVVLCLEGRCPSAIAADINPEPLKRGQNTILAAGVSDKIETRLSDGLKAVNADEVDDIVIAGMGGELIARVIDDCVFKHDSSKRFILQPMTKSEFLIKWLGKNGFEILKQDCCVAADKCYTVLLAKYTGKITDDELYCYLAKLNPRQSEAQLRFVKEQIKRLRKQANGDLRFGLIADKLEEIINDTN